MLSSYVDKNLLYLFLLLLFPLIEGFSMIQGGPLPCFMEEGQLQRLLKEDSTATEAENQFQSALAEFGLIEVNYSTTLNGVVLNYNFVT